MAAKTLCLSLSFLLAFHVCFGWEILCNFQTLTAQEPSSRLEAEAGFTEFWDNNNQDFRCAGGVQAALRTVHPKGLVVPFYSDLPGVSYIVQGSGIWGITLPWCAEANNTVRRFRAGDTGAILGGFTKWLYNDGDEDIIIITVSYYNAYEINYQLNGDVYYLAGNPVAKMSNQSSGRIADNIFKGFDMEILHEAFNIEPELILSLQGQDDTRGNIVNASGFDDFIVNASGFDDFTLGVQLGLAEQQPTQGTIDELLDVNLCTTKFQDNIVEHKATAHDYNFTGGFVNTIDSDTLPILRSVQMSVQRLVLSPNATIAPYSRTNAHSIVYVTRGSGRAEVVDNRGKSVFNGEVQRGQILVVPRNFVLLTKASNEGVEWASFQNTANSKISETTGRYSIFKAMPLQVLMNSYQISREDALKLQNI